MNFFVLQKSINAGAATGTEFFPADMANVGDAPRCSVCGKFTGMLPLLAPIRVVLESSGREWGDICFGSGTQLLFSDRAKRVLSNAELAGLARFEPTEIARVQSHHYLPEPPEYWLVSIPYSEAAIDAVASGLVLEKELVCPACRLGGIIKKISRVVLEAGTWQGEDIFVARGLPGTILISERFERLCIDERLSNFLPIPAEDFSFDFYPPEKR
jgi:hypothetical protein